MKSNLIVWALVNQKTVVGVPPETQITENALSVKPIRTLLYVCRPIIGLLSVMLAVYTTT